MSEIKSTIFRAYDIRGIYDSDIDQTVFYQIGQATGTYVKHHLKGSAITVGNDIRKTSESLVSAFMAGVTRSGVNVVHTGTSSFGQTLFSGWNQHHDLISFITASHLPAEWNGVKFYYGDGVGLPEKELMKIRDITLQKQWKTVSWDRIGSIGKYNPNKGYCDFFSSRFKYNKDIKVAVDCGGASMTLSAPDVLSHLGLTVIPVFCDPDPLFSVRPSDPKPENLSSLVNIVTENHCDFGVAFDGDGDRAVIVDNEGEVLSADQTGIILGKYGIQDPSGTVVVNVECSKAVDEQLQPLGYKMKHIPVGHTFLTLHAKQEQSPLGIESSGHIIIPEYFLFDDALVIPLKIAEILDATPKKLSDLHSEIPMYPRKKVEISCDDTVKFEVISELQSLLSNDHEDINTLDGIRVGLESGWLLIRASNTSPSIRLTVEADTKSQMEKIAQEFEILTKKYIKKHNG